MPSTNLPSVLLTMKKRIFLLWLLTILLLPCSAYQSDMIVEHYTTEQGLPNNTVNFSLKGRDGFLWFGTWYGLCSFDGVRFTSYGSRTNANGDIPPRKVLEMAEDGKGYLWLRTVDNRLYVFNKETENFREIYEELKQKSQNLQVIKVQRIDDGKILLWTRNKSLFTGMVNDDGSFDIRPIYDANRDINPYDMKLKHNVIGENKDYFYWFAPDYRITVIPKSTHHVLLSKLKGIVSSVNDDGSSLWISTLTGELYRYELRKGVLKHYTFPVKFTDVRNVFVDKYGVFWLTEGDKDIVCYNISTGEIRKFAIGNQRNITNLSFQDAGENGLFVLLKNGQVWHFDRNTKELHSINDYREMNTENANQLYTHIKIDKDGILWLCSTDNGAYKICFPPRHFYFIHPELFVKDVPNRDKLGIRGLYQTRNGDIWVGTRWGDVYCMDEKYNVKRYYKGTLGNVYNIFEDDQGRLWFATKGAGLIKAIPDAASPQGYRMTRYTYDASDMTSISSNNVYYVYQDSHRRLWVCTYGGGLNLIEEQGERIIFHHKFNGFRDYPQYGLFMDVRSMTEDRNGRMWVATVDGLLSFENNFSHIDDILFETYRGQNSAGLLENDVYSLYKDSSGNIWLGVFGGGLNKIVGYDENKHLPVLKTYSTHENLGNDVVSTIVEDRRHCLWLCTKNGLSSMDRNSAVMRSYDRFDGFPTVQTEDASAIYLRNGDMWIGSKQGILCFSPDEIKYHLHQHYNTFIVNFNVLNKNFRDFNPPLYNGSIRYAKEIRLKHDQSMFTIEYATLNFSNINNVSYRYILEGYENQWHSSGQNRIASYANVPHGHYVFRVQVIDESDGGVASQCSLKITILPPWWATWWAYVIYCLLGITVAILVLRLIFYMIRMRNEAYVNDRLAELKLRFFTNVSHELRTPLSLIQGPIDEIKKNEHLSVSGRQYLALMEKNAVKMLQLVNQILDFRKIQNGKMRLHVSLIDMNNLLETFYQEFHVLAEDRNITYIFHLPNNHVMAWGDAEKLGIVVRNLLSNAFKFTHKDGMVNVTLESLDDGKRCRIKVEDDGVAIPKSQLDVIFDRFTQADNAKDDTSYTGTGIGLSLSREYVMLHHGKIWAESGDKNGAVFIVELPTVKENFTDEDVDFYVDDHTASTSAEGSENDMTDKTGEKKESEAFDTSLPILLLIEDNLDLCAMLKLQMSRLYNVVTANDGAEGMRRLYQCHPDIVVTDLMMPIMDGLEVLNRIRADFSISHIPVIVLTAKSSDDDRMEAIKEGANAYITKPFSKDILVARINQLISERRLFQEKMVTMPVSSSLSERKGSYEQHLEQRDMEFIRRTNELIEKNLNETDFNIDSIAVEVGLSRSAFFKKLKSLTGLAPVDLIKEIRLNKAVGLMDSTDLSITEIAYQVGFKDSGYFGKCFRKKYNMTPKEYRTEKNPHSSSQTKGEIM